jgi:hypothetical protein
VAIPQRSVEMKLADARAEVDKSIGSDRVDHLVEFVRGRHPHLWGSEQPRSFVEVNVVLSLYKDLFGKGFDKIVESIELPFMLSKLSIMHNVRVVRGHLAAWGKAQTPLGTPAEWNAAARHLDKPPSLSVRSCCIVTK